MEITRLWLVRQHPAFAARAEEPKGTQSQNLHEALRENEKRQNSTHSSPPVSAFFEKYSKWII
jgi:hypothetical protein